jgi:uncharacterized protein (DUF58 family)
MIPTLRFVNLLAGWFVIGICASVWERFVPVWWISGGVIGTAAVLDAMALFLNKPVRAERLLPSRLALGVPQEIALTLHNPNSRAVGVEFFDGLPETVGSTQLPWSGSVPARGFIEVNYIATPLERGPVAFAPCHVRQLSLLGLWQRAVRTGGSAEVKVYPNYEPVVRYTLLAMSNRQSQMGIIAKNRVGQSREFHQLRDYQDGDVLSQVDWKATARRGQIISREYREQRDQTLVFMLDCGRRMRALDGALPQFDHCLNATLLLSYIALRQGDSVGLMSFGGTNRWLPPVKGQHSMSALLNHLYDYQSSTAPSDFSEAAERLLARQRRRALVVLLTNLRTEDASNLLPPLALLRRRHLVVIASLRERQVVERLKQPVRRFDDALLNAAGHGYIEERSQFLAMLRDYGVLTLDETAEALPSALASAYLDIKKRGAL